MINYTSKTHLLFSPPQLLYLIRTNWWNYILYGFTFVIYIPSVELSELESSSIYISTVSYEGSTNYKDLKRDWLIKEIFGEINGVKAINIYLDPEI